MNCISDVMVSGIQQEQNSESTDVDEPFSPSTKETFDIDSTSPQTFSATSDSAPSERQHGAVSAEAAAVDAALEVELEDSMSSSLLPQSLDVSAGEETADKVHESEVTELPVLESDATDELEMVLSSDVTTKTVIEEEEEKRHNFAEEDASYQEEVSTDAKHEVEEQDVDVSEAQADDGDEGHKCVPQISISVCSSHKSEDNDDLPDNEDTSVFEEDSSYQERMEEETKSHDATEISAGTVTCSDAEAQQDKPEQTTEDTAVDHQTVMTAESLSFTEPSLRETEQIEGEELQAVEPTTPVIERNLSQYQPEIQEMYASAVDEKHERKELAESETDAQRLHDARLLCSSSESMVSSTTSDWTVVDTREDVENIDNLSTETGATDTRHELLAHTEFAASREEDHFEEFEVKDEALAVGEQESGEEDDEGDTVDDYLTATVTPTVDLMVMSTALESILEEEERTSSSQKTTSSSEKLEHDVSDSSKLVGSSADVQHAAESPTLHLAGKFSSDRSSDRDDVSVSSSLAEFERLEKELQEKGSSDSFSGDKGSSGSASAVAAAESPQRKSSTSLSSSLAEFEHIEREILGQSGSLELVTIDRKSHHTDSSSFSELERIEEMDKNGTIAEEQYRSSSGSLAEFEYIEQQLRLNEEVESEALKVATMFEKSQISSAEKSSPEAGSSQSDVRLSKEQIPESVESVSAEDIAQAAASAEAQYPHYQDIVHIIREASKNVETFQFGEKTSSVTETVSQVDSTSKLRQEETTTELFHADTSTTKTTLSEDISATVEEVSTYSVLRTERDTEETQSSVEQRSESTTIRHELSHELESTKLFASTTDEQIEKHEVTHLRSEEEAAATASDVIAVDETVYEHRDDVDLMKLSTDSLVGIQSDDVMQLSTDSLQPMTTSTDSLELADVHGSSTSTLSSVNTLLAADGQDDEGRCLMERSTDSLESDSREPSGEWVTVYEADTTQDEKTAEEDVMAESTDSLEAQFGARGDEAGVVSGSASFESFEADSLQDDVDEEPTLVSSQSQDSLLVTGNATIPMDISFGSSGAWSQSNVSSCTTLASSSDGEALTCSVDVSRGGAAERRLSEPSSSTPLSVWTDNTSTLLDSEGNILVADEPRTPRPDDVKTCLDNRQSETTDKESVERTGHPAQLAGDVQADTASAAVTEPPGILL